MHQFAPQRDEVGAAVFEYLLGLPRIDDDADRHRHDPGLCPDAAGKRYLEAGRARRFRSQRLAIVGAAETRWSADTAGRTIDHIDTDLCQAPGELHRVIQRPAPFAAVDRRDPREQRHAVRDRGAHRGRHFERKTHASLEITAIGILASIAERRQETVQQITVRHVQLEHAKAAGAGAPGGIDEGLPDLCQPVGIEFRRRVPTVGHRQRRRRDGLPGFTGPRRIRFVERYRPPFRERRTGRSLAPGVRQLHARHAVHRLDEFDDRHQRLGLCIVPDTEAVRRNAPARLDRGGLGEDETRLAAREGAQVGEMPRLGDAVDRRVLAQRRHHDSIRQDFIADIERLKKFRHSGHGADTSGENRAIIRARRVKLKTCRKPSIRFACAGSRGWHGIPPAGFRRARGAPIPGTRTLRTLPASGSRVARPRNADHAG